MQNQDIGRTILRYLRNELTSEQELALQYWLDESPANRKFFDDVKNAPELHQELSEFAIDKFDENFAWAKLVAFAKLKGENWEVTKHKTSPSVLKFWPYAAAIVLILSVGTAFWKYLIPPSGNSDKLTKTTTEEKLQSEDFAPGGNHAILSLANGQSIILNNSTADNQILQGSTTVKISGKAVTYTSTSSMNEQAPQLINTVTTPFGGQFQLNLPDGSKAWLNAGSSISFPVAFNGRERKVEITGEVFFDIVSDPQLPFRVTVRDLDVVVLGTQFNVNAYTAINAAKKVKTVSYE